MSTRTAVAEALDALKAQARSRNPERIPLLGLAGSQGSGKSFQTRAYAAAHAPQVASFSLDDVYLTRAEREAMAKDVNPLFITRGPPGTHDLGLAQSVIESLRTGKPTAPPRFDKVKDDRAPQSDWAGYNSRADLILMEGWCLGAAALEPTPPLNALEREQDAGGLWVSRVLEYLRGYQSFFDLFDGFVYLRAPSFDIVRRWRGEQERELRGRALTADEEARLDRFVAHYERITRAMLDGAHRAAWILHLDEKRAVQRIEKRA